MKEFLMVLSVFSATTLWAAGDEENKGTLELIHEPKNCLMAPCPQYRVVSINGVKAEALGADILNFDPQKTTAAAFKKFSVEGEWTKKENYLEVTVSEWHITLREKVQSKIPEKAESK